MAYIDVLPAEINEMIYEYVSWNDKQYVQKPMYDEVLQELYNVTYSIKSRINGEMKDNNTYDFAIENPDDDDNVDDDMRNAITRIWKVQFNGFSWGLSPFKPKIIMVDDQEDWYDDI